MDRTSQKDDMSQIDKFQTEDKLRNVAKPKLVPDRKK